MNPSAFRALPALSLCAALLAGCAGGGAPTNLYDFGPLSAAPAASPSASALVVVLADPTGPSWLDEQRMYYRLLYADPLQTRAYAAQQWNATPLQLLGQRLRARLAQSGVKVLTPTDAAAGTLLLRIEVDDFSQSFDAPASSSGQLALRASLFRGHRLLDQRAFRRAVPAGRADAAGGARALGAAADAVAADLLDWLGRAADARE